MKTVKSIVGVALGLTLANFLYQFFGKSPDYEMAMILSWYQFFGIGIYVLSTKLLVSE